MSDKILFVSDLEDFWRNILQQVSNVWKNSTYSTNRAFTEGQKSNFEEAQ